MIAHNTDHILRRAKDATELGASCVRDLETMFTAVIEHIGNPAFAGELARIGHYLAAQWAEKLEEECETLTGMRSAGGNQND